MTAPSRVAVPAEVSSLATAAAAGVLGPAEVHLAAWVARAAGVTDPAVHLATAMATWAARHGHSCADLGEVADVVARDAGRTDATDGPTLSWPSSDTWLASLRAAPADVVRQVSAVDPGPVLDSAPLVLHGDRVFLQRHWVDECAVAASIRARAVPTGDVLSAEAEAVLDALLPVSAEEPNLQRLAAETVLHHRLSLIVGGPGTGKTYSVARLLAVLLQQGEHDGRHLRVALAAPTGKAAARLQESVGTALAHPDVVAHLSPDVRRSLGDVTPSTIHRLLGPLGDRRQRFRHDAANPLPHDVVVIDETSMLSLPLLARLCEALRPEARLVLIGDPDQLESVELGAVLGDLVRASESPDSPLHGRVVRLVRGHRFGGGSPIALLADGVRLGDAAEAEHQLRSGGNDVRFIETDDPLDPAVVAEVAAVVVPALASIRAAAEAGRDDAALDAMAATKILCAHRLGPFGVSAWNELGERWLRGDDTSTAWYAGRPLLATRNDARLGLANGDTGVVVRDGDRLVAAFRTALGTQRFEPVQLEDVETAYAMTVHKSQGSEYPTVVMILPPPTSALVGRELVYTAVTRARTTLVVVGGAATVRRAVASPAHRMTGLADALSITAVGTPAPPS